MDNYNTDNNEAAKTKADRVLFSLRESITNGFYKPGQQIPTFDEMETHFKVSRSVLQKALRTLTEDGFVSSSPRKGMHVAPVLPHLTRYALVFTKNMDSPGFSHMQKTILDSAQSIAEKDPHRQYVIYDGIHSQDGSTTLHEDIENQRIAGLIVTPGADKVFVDYPELETDSYPRVFMCMSRHWGYNPSVDVDRSMFYDRAIWSLTEKGRRRIAIIHMAHTFADIDHATLFAANGVEYHKPWIQQIGRSHPECAQNLVQLLFDDRGGTVPDGLIIADDNLTEHVIAGLLQVNRGVGKDLDVVAYCHWPWRTSSLLPIRYLGFNLTEVLIQCMDVVLKKRLGQEFPENQFIPAVFEEELKAPSSYTRSLRQKALL
ncbi:MAG: GntR family transcriptional regulator [Planctomycetes bacterium]|nr:GntR family transcriptional regulator [Planctomycetota bacterium]